MDSEQKDVGQSDAEQGACLGQQSASATSRETVVLFDLDGTVTRHDTYLAFLLFVLLHRPARFGRCWRLPYILLQFSLGSLSNDALKAQFLRAILGGFARPDVMGLAERFVARRAHRLVKARALDRIAWHASNGHRLILLTGSLDLYAEMLGTWLGIPQVIATRVAWAGGTISGELLGPNLRGTRKLAVVKELIAAAADRPMIIAYSDSHTDLPLLRFADRGVAIDPDRRLAVAAPSCGLAVESWLC